MPSGAAGHGGHPKSGKGSPVEIKKDQIVSNLSADQQKRAEECLKKNGQIKITFKEISVTQLPARLDNGEKID